MSARPLSSRSFGKKGPPASKADVLHGLIFVPPHARSPHPHARNPYSYIRGGAGSFGNLWLDNPPPTRQGLFWDPPKSPPLPCLCPPPPHSLRSPDGQTDWTTDRLADALEHFRERPIDTGPGPRRRPTPIHGGGGMGRDLTNVEVLKLIAAPLPGP